MIIVLAQEKQKFSLFPCVSPLKSRTQLKFWERSVQVNQVLLKKFSYVSPLSEFSGFLASADILLSLYLIG